VATAADRPAGQTLVFQTRTREAMPSGRHAVQIRQVEWPAEKTAFVVCDMWDQHWSPTATRRVAEMAPRMNALLKVARDRGALIIHCPSDTLDFYKDAPQRALAQAAPVVPTTIPLERWCRLQPDREGALPIDDSDGGCDALPPGKNHKAWTRQIATLEIFPQDAITDSAEAFYLMQARGIDRVVVMGVHTNMCVLGRPFSIRQMVRQGQQVLLLRDLTDTMYNPRRAPYVHHCTGTDLVVEHIEKHWCPTATSVDLLGGREFRFSEDTRPHAVVLMAEDEYRTEVSLPAWVARHLGREFRTTLLHGSESERNDLPGLETLKTADVLLVSVRRRVLPAAQLQQIRDFIERGGAVVGIRTASHAFSLRDNAPPPEGHAAWLDFDPEVLGGHYTGHHGEGPQVALSLPTGSPAHPLLTGVDLAQLSGKGSLYKVNPLATSAIPVLIGEIPGVPAEPVAWTYTNRFGGRVFYTSLGHVDDFAQPGFQRLLLNGLRWASGLPIDPPASEIPAPPAEKTGG
jgi:nicotinamidase-related amidase/type 1 glutamine amidotransferase